MWIKFSGPIEILINKKLKCNLKLCSLKSILCKQIKIQFKSGNWGGEGVKVIDFQDLDQNLFSPKQNNCNQ